MGQRCVQKQNRPTKSIHTKETDRQSSHGYKMNLQIVNPPEGKKRIWNKKHHRYYYLNVRVTGKVTTNPYDIKVTPEMAVRVTITEGRIYY